MIKAMCLTIVTASLFVLGLNSMGLGQTWKQLLDKADSLSKAQNQDSAIELGGKALRIAEKEYGQGDTTVARILNKLGGYNYLRGTYGEALEMCRTALSIRERQLGSLNEQVASTLDNLGDILWDKGNPDEAEESFEQALDIRIRLYGADGEQVARSANDLAMHYKDHGKYPRSENLYRMALRIKEKNNGHEHPDVAKIMHNLASVLRNEGRFSESESFFLKALAILQRNFGDSDWTIAATSNALANLYGDLGKYSDAEALLKKALRIREKSYGLDHPTIAETTDNLAILCQELGRYTEAEAYYSRTLDIRRKAYGSDHPWVALTMNNLATLYEETGRLIRAESLYAAVLPIIEKVYGVNHPYTGSALMNLAIVEDGLRKFSAAESLYEKSTRTIIKAYGTSHPEVAKVLLNTAKLELHRNRGQIADSLCRVALSLDIHILGSRHPTVASDLEFSSFVNRMNGHYDSSVVEALNAFVIRQENLKNLIGTMSEKDAVTYSASMRNSAANLLSIFLDLKSPRDSLRGRIADMIIQAKGQVSDEVLHRSETLQNQNEPSARALQDSLCSIRFQVSQIFVTGPGDDTTGLYRKRLDSLGNLANDIEAELGIASASFLKNKELSEVNTAKIIQALPNNTALVEYMRYDYSFPVASDSSEPRYVILIVSSSGSPVIKDLGPAAAVDSLVARYRRHFQKISGSWPSESASDQAEIDVILRKLYISVWQPIADKLGQREMVLIAPDGALNLISFASLKDGDSYLIEKYPIHYLSAGRDLLRLKEKIKLGIGLFALGDPDYDAPPQARLRLDGGQMAAMTDSGGYSAYVTRNVRPGCQSLSEIEVAPLPYTRREVEQVAGTWRSKYTEPVQVCLAAAASEDNFKRNSAGKKVIHLATHGYFIDEACRPSFMSQRSRIEAGFIGENPLLLSGLLLAGANLHGAGADSLGAEDGVLTAEEVSGMNLTGTQWVVLSACESGLGQVQTGEGVYGLRRAFQMAGARTVMSSLWPVSDKETSRIMAYLYGYRGDNLAIAFREMALEQIKMAKSKKLPDDPYIWAPFITVGDWKVGD